MRGIIYKYTSPSGKVYIGQTVDEEGRRYAFNNLFGYAGSAINLARLKYGTMNFKYEVLEKYDDEDTSKLFEILDEREMYWINEMHSDDPKFGYNMTEGGQNWETKEKIVDGKIKVEINDKCKKSVRPRISEDVRRKLSEAQKRRLENPEYRMKLSEARKGKHINGSVHHKVIYKGVVYKNKSEAVRKTGDTRYNVNKYCEIYNPPAEVHMTNSDRNADKRKPIVYEGILYGSLTEACIMTGASINTIKKYGRFL